jgi:hypothetical protein
VKLIVQTKAAAMEVQVSAAMEVSAVIEKKAVTQNVFSH